MDTAAVGPPWFSCWLCTEASRPQTRNNELSDQFAEENTDSVGATPVSCEQAIHLHVDALSGQSHRKSTGVII